MQIDYYSSTQEILRELGRRIKAQRIALPATQQEMAENTGLSLKTISNLETGKDVSFSTMVEVLRAIGRLQALDVLVPEAEVRPSQVIEYGKMRERAPRKSVRLAEQATGWKWGDEQ